MRVGVVDYLLRCSDPTLFYLARELGFDAVEISADPASDPHRLFFDPDRADDLLTLARATSISISSLFAIPFLRLNLLDADTDARKRATLMLRGIAERSAQVGIPVAVVPLLGASSPVGDDHWVYLEQLLPSLAEWGRSLGISFAIKTSLAGDVIARALADYRTTHVGLSFDPALITAIGRDCLREWDAVRPHVRHVHLSDRTLDAEAAPLGRGDVPMTRLIERFVADGYQGAFVLKSCIGHDASAALKRDLSYLHRQLSQNPSPSREAA